MKTSIPPVLIAFSLPCFALSPRAQAVSPAAGRRLFRRQHGGGARRSFAPHHGCAKHGGWFSFTEKRYRWQLQHRDWIRHAAREQSRWKYRHRHIRIVKQYHGRLNTANGALALFSNADGLGNTAVGYTALFSNISGSGNTAFGSNALSGNTRHSNAAFGSYALSSNTTGDANTAMGAYALYLLDGGDSYNIALGYFAGGNVVNGINDIFIGNIGPVGQNTDQNTIRIGTQVTAYDFLGGVHNRHVATYIAGISEAGVSGAPVLVSADGQLGIALSAVRFKEAIKPIDTASEAIFALNPVTFRYKEQFDPKRVPQFGLVAEEVEKVNPDLVRRDRDGELQTVRYDAVNAMLLNEFLKEHRKVEKLEATVEGLAATVKEQAAEISKSERTA